MWKLYRKLTHSNHGKLIVSSDTAAIQHDKASNPVFTSSPYILAVLPKTALTRRFVGVKNSLHRAYISRSLPSSSSCSSLSQNIASRARTCPRIVSAFIRPTHQQERSVVDIAFRMGLSQLRHVRSATVATEACPRLKGTDKRFLWSECPPAHTKARVLYTRDF